MKALSSLTVFLHKLNLLMVFWGDPGMIKQISFRDQNTFPNGSSLETAHKKYKILNCTLIIGLACHDNHQRCSYDFVKWKKLKICFVNSQQLQLKDLCCFINLKVLKTPCPSIDSWLRKVYKPATLTSVFCQFKSMQIKETEINLHFQA